MFRNPEWGIVSMLASEAQKLSGTVATSRVPFDGQDVTIRFVNEIVVTTPLLGVARLPLVHTTPKLVDRGLEWPLCANSGHSRVPSDPIAADPAFSDPPRIRFVPRNPRPHGRLQIKVAEREHILAKQDGPGVNLGSDSNDRCTNRLRGFHLERPT